MARFAPPSIELVPRPDGGCVLRSRTPLPPVLRCLGDALVRWAAEAPARTFLAERDRRGHWVEVSYAAALASARAIGEGLLARGLGPDRPLLLLAGNSLDHALLALGAMHAGIPVAPVSVAYALLDPAKLCALAAAVSPGAVYADPVPGFAPAVAALGLPTLDLAALRATPPGPAIDAAFAAVTGDTVAKLLFTSGSTGAPKAVINTQHMVCANQAALAAGWPFLAARPPVIVDWLPWSHTFGGNHNFNLVLVHGGTLYIDAGKPAAGAFDTTLRNLREVRSTIHFNVPRGFDMLVDELEEDAALAASFFAELEVVFYAAAALSPATWARLAALAARAGRDIAMTSAWGSTETSPLVTQVCFPIDRAGVIGVPVPGCELALVPRGDQLELRVRGPQVAPGYRTAAGIEPLPLDADGFYPMGDAGALADPADPGAGIVFAGRTAENFKLASGTWVHVGEVRLALLAACAPLLADAAITGADRGELGALVFVATGQVIDDALRGELATALARHAAAATGSSTRIARIAIQREAPSIGDGEITDKGYLNQRATLTRRAAAVEALYAGEPGADPDAIHAEPPAAPGPGPGASPASEDLALLARWRSGDAAAGEALFRRHFDSVYGFFATKCAAEADELVQATFLACLRARDQFRGDASFRTYLFTIARHELYRALAARKRAADRLDFEVSSIADLVSTPGTRLDRDHAHRTLVAALQGLPVDQQMLLELHYWQELEIAQLAAIFEAAPGAIRTRLHRARRALRERIDRLAPPDATAKLGAMDRWVAGQRPTRD